MNSQIYTKNCSKCKKETKHLVVMISRKRGVKLKCMNCGFVSNRYSKLISLQEKVK